MKGNITRILRYIVYGVFFILTFIYCWHYLDPSLIYFKQQPLFLFDKHFFYKYTGYPGGISEYLSLFIMQFFCSRFAGSILIVTLIMIIISLSYQILSGFFSKGTSHFLQFIPGLLLIQLHSHYDYDLRGDLVVVFALIFALVYYEIITRSPYFKAFLLFLSDCLLFFFLGGTALMLYSAIIILAEIYRKPHHLFWLWPVFQILACIILAFIAFIAFPGVIQASEFPGIFFPEWDENKGKYLYILFGAVPFFLLIQTIIHHTLEKQHFYQHFISDFIPSKRIVISLLASLLILGFVCIDYKLSFDPSAKDAIRLNVYAGNGDWNAVLATANKLSSVDRKVIFQVNRALYHLNRLPDEAFNYSQYWGENGLILTSHYSGDVLMLCSDLYFDMGHCKGSLHWAYEAQTKSEQSPEVLKRIAINNMILGEYKAAEKFLFILSKSWMHRKWASHYLSCLHDDTLMGKEAFIQEKRKLLPRSDFFTSTQQPNYDLYKLFTGNPDNKMAFEYFIIYSMLIHNLSDVARNINFLEKLHYGKIPTHIEEALLLFMTLNQDYPVALGKLQISERTKKRFAAYSQIMMKYKKDMKDAQAELYNKFGNTYWYYIHYISPLTTKRKIHEKPL